MNSNSFQPNTIDFNRHSISIWFQSSGLLRSSFFLFISVSDIFIFRMKVALQLDYLCNAFSKIQLTFKKNSKWWKLIKISKFKCLNTALLEFKANLIILVRYLTSNGFKRETPSLTMKWDLLDIYLFCLKLSEEPVLLIEKLLVW